MFWISFPNRFLSKNKEYTVPGIRTCILTCIKFLEIAQAGKTGSIQKLHCSYVKMFIVMWRYVPRASFFKWRTQMKPMPVFFNNTVTPYNFWKNLNFWPKLVVFENFQNHLLC